MTLRQVTEKVGYEKKEKKPKNTGKHSKRIFSSEGKTKKNSILLENETWKEKVEGG